MTDNRHSADNDEHTTDVPLTIDIQLMNCHAWSLGFPSQPSQGTDPSPRVNTTSTTQAWLAALRLRFLVLVLLASLPRGCFTKSMWFSQPAHNRLTTDWLTWLTASQVFNHKDFAETWRTIISTPGTIIKTLGKIDEVLPFRDGPVTSCAYKISCLSDVWVCHVRCDLGCFMSDWFQLYCACISACGL